MIAEYQKKSNIGVGVGFLIAVVGRVLQYSGGAAGATGGQGLVEAGNCGQPGRNRCIYLRVRQLCAGQRLFALAGGTRAFELYRADSAGSFAG